MKPIELTSLLFLYFTFLNCSDYVVLNSFNGIDCELLFKTCQEIQAELTKRRRSRFPLLELDLSGNIFYLEWRKRLIQTLMDCVDVFVAQDPNLGNLAGPLADHIAQM